MRGIGKSVVVLSKMLFIYLKWKKQLILSRNFKGYGYMLSWLPLTVIAAIDCTVTIEDAMICMQCEEKYWDGTDCVGEF